MHRPNDDLIQNQPSIPGRISDTDAALPAARRMGASGGSVGLAGERVTLDVPAGVFPEDVDVSVTAVDDKEDLLIDDKRVSVIRRVNLEARRADGKEFAGKFGASPTLRIGYSWEDLRWSVSGRVSILGRRNPSDPWREIPSVNDRQRQVVTAELRHFSEYLANVEADLAIVPTIDGYQTNLQTGAATVSIPIKLPPGTNGLTPKLALTYSSAGPNGIISENHSTYEKAQGSWVGVGWNLDLGHIELEEAPRPRGRIVLNGRSNELIVSRIDASGLLRLRTQVDNFVKINRLKVSTPEDLYYVATTKDGTKYRYGHESRVDYKQSSNFYNATGSRQDGYWESIYDSCGRGGYTWRSNPIRYNLDQIKDTSGNTVEITYRADEGARTVSNNCADRTVRYDRAVYPNEIHYSLNDSGGYKRKVIFVTSDPATNAREDIPSNVRYYETRRLERVETYVADSAGVWSLVRKYVFEYEYVTYASEGNKKFLLLKKLTEYDGAGNALPATTFDYAPQSGVTQYEGWANHSTQKCPIPLLTRVDNGYGGSVENSYAAFNWAGNGGSSNRRTRQWVVSARTSRDGMGNSFVTRYNRAAPSPSGNHVAGLHHQADQQLLSGLPRLRHRGGSGADRPQARAPLLPRPRRRRQRQQGQSPELRWPHHPARRGAVQRPGVRGRLQEGGRRDRRRPDRAALDRVRDQGQSSEPPGRRSFPTATSATGASTRSG